jgi:hypothetical protein
MQDDMLMFLLETDDLVGLLQYHDNTLGKFEALTVIMDWSAEHLIAASPDDVVIAGFDIEDDSDV